MNRETEQLFDAVQNNNLNNGAKFLVRNGADVNAKHIRNGNTPLHIATRNRSTEVAKSLIENGADVNAKNLYDGNTPLHTAAEAMSTELVKFLIENGADVNSQDSSGATPLFWAARDSSAEYLVKQRVNPVLIFMRERYAEVIKILVENGADVDAQNVYGLTPLVMAMDHDCVEVVKTLIENGADVNSKGGLTQKTALHFAVEGRKTGAAKFIIEYTLLQNFNAEKPNFLNGTEELSNHWDQCKVEIDSMKEFNLGFINNQSQRVYLYDFLREKDDVNLAKCYINREIKDRLSNLNFEQLPVYFNILTDQREKGEKISKLYNIIDSGKISVGNIPEVAMQRVNEFLGNDHKSRVNLLLACPPSRVEQPNVEPALPNNLHV